MGAAAAIAPVYRTDSKEHRWTKPIAPRPKNKCRCFCTKRFVDADEPVVVVGERINPTGKNCFRN